MGTSRRPLHELKVSMGIMFHLRLISNYPSCCPPNTMLAKRTRPSRFSYATQPIEPWVPYLISRTLFQAVEGEGGSPTKGMSWV
jgi:hypothetical protein